MKAAGKRLAGLRRYHVSRTIKTRSKLLEALDRMESGHTVVVAPGFTWSKMTLAQGVGININTVVRKVRNGEWAFPEINERFETVKQERLRVVTAIDVDVKEQMLLELRNEVKRLGKENRRLALEINRVGRQALEERDKADRMADYERQNISLREEINHLQQARSARGGGRVQ